MSFNDCPTQINFQYLIIWKLFMDVKLEVSI